jgi:hypothetical protein
MSTSARLSAGNDTILGGHLAVGAEYRPSYRHGAQIAAVSSRDARARVTGLDIGTVLCNSGRGKRATRSLERAKRLPKKSSRSSGHIRERKAYAE